jgi:DNA-binding CsgD family transcriptional regulator
MDSREVLSERELEILAFVATGAGNKEIADSLSISVNTVKVHLRNIFSKLNVNSRTEAALHAIRNELIDVSGTQLGYEYLPDTGEVPFGGKRGEIDRRVQNGRNTWTISLALVGIVLLAIVGMFILIQTNPSNNSLEDAQGLGLSLNWKENARLPIPRSNFASAVYDGQIYLIGGDTSAGVTSRVDVFDPGLNGWRKAVDKPTPVTEIQAAVLSGFIYLPGGKDNAGHPTDRFEVFDPRIQSWIDKSPLPVPLSSYALASLDGKLFVFGGWDGNQYVNTVYEYEPSQDLWHVRSPMPTARGFAGTVAIGGAIYIIGGYDGEQSLSNNEIYIPELDVEGETPWGNGKPLPRPRHAMGISSLGGIIHVVGGVGAEPDQFSYQYFPQQDTWQAIASPFKESWSGMGLVGIGTDLHILGGLVSEGITNQNLSFQALYSIAIPIVQ